MGQQRNEVMINNNPLFDEVSHTQGGVPHLLQHLWDAYTAYLQEKIEERTLARQPTVSIPEALTRAPATAFVQWASEYLHEHRVVENFFVDMNHGVRLSNNVFLVVCPGITIQGTMQDAGAIGVTEGKSQTGQGGVFNPGKALQI